MWWSEADNSFPASGITQTTHTVIREESLLKTDSGVCGGLRLPASGIAQTTHTVIREEWLLKTDFGVCVVV